MDVKYNVEGNNVERGRWNKIQHKSTSIKPKGSARMLTYKTGIFLIQKSEQKLFFSTNIVSAIK